MVEILKLAHYSWREADGKVGPQTQVTWRNDKGQVKVTILPGTIRDREKLKRKVRLHRG